MRPPSSSLERVLKLVLAGFIAFDFLLVVPAFASELRLDLIHPSLPVVRLDSLRLAVFQFVGEVMQDSEPEFTNLDTPTVLLEPPAPTPTPTWTPTPIVHEVQPGDTLGKIAQVYGSTVNAIAAANSISNPNLIFVGQQLVIPASSTPSPTIAGIQLPTQVPSATLGGDLTPTQATTAVPSATEIPSLTPTATSTPIQTAMATLTQVPSYTPTSPALPTEQSPSMTPSQVVVLTATVICTASATTACQPTANPTSTPTAISTPTATWIPTTAPPPIVTLSPGTIPAFPGAEGWGAGSIGGRGGVIIDVTNLNNDGPGSLRECAQESSGPRICVFRVAGEIVLAGSRLKIRNPYLTIAGQTAPGDGITLRAGDDLVRPIINFEDGVHDVVIRYLTVRGGKGSGERDGLTFRGGHNIILDHVTVEWATDEVVGLNPNVGETVSNITIQRSILAEAFRPHSTGVALHGGDALSQITLHHNLLAHNAHRNPRVNNTQRVEFINNVVYNWHSRAGETVSGAEVDFIGNYFKAGPWSSPENIIRHEDSDPGMPDVIYPDPSIYSQDNLAMPFQPDPSADNWNLFNYHWRLTGSLPTSWRRFASIPSPIPVTVESAQGAYDSVLADVGNNARLDSMGNWVFRLDIIDRNILGDLIQGTGPAQDSEIDHQDDFGGYPAINPGTPYADTDKDGMADVWESLYCFDPNDPSDGPGDADGDGYTNVEEFLNGTQPTAGGHC